MEIDLDTFLVTVYVIVDDLYKREIAPYKPVRRGHKPEVSDSEVSTLVLLAQWQHSRSEREFLTYVGKYWRGCFPRLLSQSAFNRRVRDLAGALCYLGPAVSRQLCQVLAVEPAYEVIDGVPVPLMRRCRGGRSRLFGNEASIGRGGSDRDWYYGVKLEACVNAQGTINGFVFGPANTEEHWLAESLFRWRRYPEAPAPTAQELAPVLGPAHRHRGQRLGPSGPIGPRIGAGKPSSVPCISDLGLRGQNWHQHWREDYRTTVLTKAIYAELPEQEKRKASRWLSGLRQVVETVFSQLTDVLGLSFPKARSYQGLMARIGAKVAALNIAIFVNYHFGRPTFSLFNPLL